MPRPDPRKRPHRARKDPPHGYFFNKWILRLHTYRPDKTAENRFTAMAALKFFHEIKLLQRMSGGMARPLRNVSTSKAMKHNRKRTLKNRQGYAYKSARVIFPIYGAGYFQLRGVE